MLRKENITTATITWAPYYVPNIFRTMSNDKNYKHHTGLQPLSFVVACTKTG